MKLTSLLLISGLCVLPPAWGSETPHPSPRSGSIATVAKRYREYRLPYRTDTKEAVVQQYRKLYAIPHCLVINDGFVGDASLRDGPINYAMKAQAWRPGNYVFVFQYGHYSSRSQDAGKIRRLIVNVKKEEDVKPRAIQVSPPKLWRALKGNYEARHIAATTSDVLNIAWSTSPRMM